MDHLDGILFIDHLGALKRQLLPELARQAPERIAHTHMKDVDAAAAARVREGDGLAQPGPRGVVQPRPDPLEVRDVLVP